MHHDLRFPDQPVRVFMSHLDAPCEAGHRRALGECARDATRQTLLVGAQRQFLSLARNHCTFGVSMLERTPRLPPAPARSAIPSFRPGTATELTDDYAWLRADNWREVMRDPSVLAPRIRGYLEAENAYAKAALGHTEALQQTLFAEMKGRIKEDDSTVPSPDGPYAYYRALPRRRTASDPVPPAARRRRRAGPARLRCARRRQAVLPAWRHRSIRPITGCSHGRRTKRDRNTTRCASATWRPAATCPT